MDTLADQPESVPFKKKRSIFSYRTGLFILVVAALLVWWIRLPAPVSKAQSVVTSYYVSPAGNDTNDGATPLTAWRTIDKVNSVALPSNSTVSFEGGQTFIGGLILDVSDGGTATEPITFTSYGTGRAIISSPSTGLLVYNRAALTVNNLIFDGGSTATNPGSGLNFYTDLPGNVKLEHLYMDNLEIRYYGQWGIKIGGWNGTSGFRDVRITNVVVHDVTLDGIGTYGKQFDFATKQYAHENIYVGNTEVYHVLGKLPSATDGKGSGIVLGNVKGGMIEKSVAHDNGSEGDGGVGIWTYDSDSVIIQFNESYLNHTKLDHDGDGFDLDQNVSNSLVQYNYSHNNDGGGIIIAHQDDNPNHTGNVIRYNISENDGRKLPYGALHVWGHPRNTHIYNNTVYLPVSPLGNVPDAFAFVDWTIESHVNKTDGLYVRNNIFQTTGGLPLVYLSESQRVTATNVFFQGNNYYPTGGAFKIKWGDISYSSLSGWRTATGQETNGQTGLSVNPLLTNPGLGGTMYPNPLSSLFAYTLQATSPMIDAGLNLSTLPNSVDPGSRDFYGASIPQGGVFDIGAHEAPPAPTPTPTPTSCPAAIIVDNAPAGSSGNGASFTGKWCKSNASGAYPPGGTSASLYSCLSGNIDTYRWTPTIATGGQYDVYVWWTANSNRSTSTSIKVAHALGTTTKSFNQRVNGGIWNLHGRYSFNAGTAGYVETKESGGEAVADAVRFVPVCGATPSATPSRTPTPTPSGPTPTPTGGPSILPGTFLESGGQVVLEGEHYASAISRGGQSWILRTSPTGWVGSGFMVSEPDSGSVINTGYTTTSPELQYSIYFQTPGTYTVWLRGRVDDLGDDSVHVGLNGAAVTSSDRMTIATLGSWVWSKKTMDSSSATIIIPSIGVYTLNVWMREDLFRLDRILLTTGTTTPSGSGPAESPRS